MALAESAQVLQLARIGASGVLGYEECVGYRLERPVPILVDHRPDEVGLRIDDVMAADSSSIAVFLDLGRQSKIGIERKKGLAGPEPGAPEVNLDRGVA